MTIWRWGWSQTCGFKFSPNEFNTPCLIFPIYKMGIIRVPASKGCREGKAVHADKLYGVD